MIRVRFHGRGGHGVKTASRILGTAAFLCGFEVQDAPVYGAERRGAAMAAFTRIDREPIEERGIISMPDLIMLADETLLDDASAHVLAGAQGAGTLFVNSAGDAESLAKRYAIACPVRTLDLSALTLEQLGRAAALSAPLGAAAAALTGIVDVEKLAKAVECELDDLRLTAAVVDNNVKLARRVFLDVGQTCVSAVRKRPVLPSIPLHRPAYAGSPMGVPVILAPGNAEERHTGSWRLFRPTIDRDICTRCGICFVQCPDGAISLDAGAYPVIDYDNCKGCMICKEVCPLHCIEEAKEVRAW